MFDDFWNRRGCSNFFVVVKLRFRFQFKRFRNSGRNRKTKQKVKNSLRETLKSLHLKFMEIFQKVMQRAINFVI